MDYCILKYDLVGKNCHRLNTCLNKRGFTLIELFIALSVLAAISAVSVSYYQDYVEEAKMTVRKTNEKLVNDAINRYYREHMTYPRYDWESDSLEDVKTNVCKGLDSVLSNYFINKNISEIFAEGSNAGGYEVCFRVTEPRKKGSLLGNVDNSSDTGTWKMAKNLRVATKDYFVNEIRIIPSDEGFSANTFNDLETFNFPIRDVSLPIHSDTSGYNIIEPEPELDIQMVCCPPGTFLMGAPVGELGKKDNELLHTVTLTKQFLISKYEITQKQYLTVMGTNPASNKASEFHPVENVSRQDAIDFCEKLNTDYSKLVPYGYKFDLPTEAQWEYACRAGTLTALNSNKNLTPKATKPTEPDPGCPNAKEVAWFNNNSGGKSHPVGQKAPNAWGIYDMHGNVEEIIKDLRHKSYPPYSPEDAVDPLVTREMITGSDNDVQRCHRGGGYAATVDRCRSASRQGSAKNSKAANIGFRVVLVQTGD